MGDFYANLMQQFARVERRYQTDPTFRAACDENRRQHEAWVKSGRGYQRWDGSWSDLDPSDSHPGT